MKRKPLTLLLIGLIFLVGCSISNKEFERGTYTKGLYKNAFFNVQFYYPEEFVEVNSNSIAFTEGCIIDSQLSWNESIETCGSNSIWDLRLSSLDGSKQTGVMIVELDKKVDAETLANQEIELAKNWETSPGFITSVYEIKIQGQPFKGFSFIYPDASNPGKEYFGMSAIRVEGNYAMLITVLVNTNNKQDFNDVLNIYTIATK